MESEDSTPETQSAKRPGGTVKTRFQRIPVHCLETPGEESVSCLPSWITLQALGCNGEDFQRKDMEPTVDPVVNTIRSFGATKILENPLSLTTSLLPLYVAAGGGNVSL